MTSNFRVCQKRPDKLVPGDICQGTIHVLRKGAFNNYMDRILPLPVTTTMTTTNNGYMILCLLAGHRADKPF